MVKDRLQELLNMRRSHGISVSDDPVVVVIEENETQKQLLALLDKLGPLYTKLKASTMMLCI